MATAYILAKEPDGKGSAENRKDTDDVIMNSKRSEILKEVGEQIETGTVSIMESHMVFPAIYVKDLD